MSAAQPLRFNEKPRPGGVRGRGLSLGYLAVKIDAQEASGDDLN
jgi:hypothetical protein